LRAGIVKYEPILQTGDILSIVVVTPNENSSKLFNRPTASQDAVAGSPSATPSAGSGYLIDANGNISIPYLGYLRAAGLTKMQLTDSLSSKLRMYVDSATVTVRLLNYKVTVLGEVVRPGSFNIPDEKVSVLDAIGLAGDLTVFGKRNNIRVIRQNESGLQSGIIDLNKGDIFNSPFYYLRQNDIVYVEMNNKKMANSDQSTLRGFGIALGIISALGVLVSTINVLSN
jgi:polysaccharide biosynthesis/export protein